MKKKNNGFTLLELLVVIGIIAILAGLLFPAITGALKTAQKNQALGDCRAIETALSQYYNEYNVYPQGSGNVSAILDILVGGRSSTAKNPRQRKFLSVNIENGSFKDPWDNEYLFVCDDNYDNEVIANGDTINRGVAVWSNGRDGQASTSDDVETW